MAPHSCGTRRRYVIALPAAAPRPADGLGHVFEDPAEIAEADRRVDAFGHRGGLQARGRAAPFGGIVDVACRERGAAPLPSVRLERGHVVDAAVTVVVEGDCRRDVLAGVSR